MKAALVAFALAGLAGSLSGCGGLPERPVPVVAIVGATVVHVDRAEHLALQRDATVIVRGERIEAVGPAAVMAVPPGAQVIDGRGRWVTPGLIDAHVHFFQSGNLYTRPDAADLRQQRPYPQEVARNQARLASTFKVWLASGVTGVVDVGGPMWNFDVRARAAQTAAAPRVAVAGPLISMIDDPLLDLGDPPIVRVDTPQAAAALAQRQAALQPEYVKVWFIHGRDDDLAAQTAIVKAAGDAAHAHGIPLAVHATELVVAKAALRAGADYLVHSVEDEPVDAEFIALMKARGALYCPTLFVTLGYDYALSDQWRPTDAEARLADPQVLASMDDLPRIPPSFLPRWVREALRDRTPPKASQTMAENLRRVRAAGIPVAMGTDAGNIGTLHGPSVCHEMALMRQAGMSPFEVLRAATQGGARALRQQERLGAIAPGRLADLLVLDADPMRDTDAASHAHRVIKSGRVFDPAALMHSLD